MTEAHSKLCPACKTPAPLNALRCAICGHQFSTRFAPSGQPENRTQAVGRGYKVRDIKGTWSPPIDEPTLYDYARRGMIHPSTDIEDCANGRIFAASENPALRSILGPIPPAQTAAPTPTQAQEESPPPNYINRTHAQRMTITLSAAEAGQAGGCLTTAGILLCLTGIGAVIGLPLLWEGYKEGQKRTREVVRGQCPYCAAEIDIQPAVQAVNCAICRKRIVVRGDFLYAL